MSFRGTTLLLDAVMVEGVREWSTNCHDKWLEIVEQKMSGKSGECKKQKPHSTSQVRLMFSRVDL